MNIKNLFSKATAFVLATACALTPVSGVMAADPDIIDTTRKGSMQLYKYDATAALEDGIDFRQWVADGKKHPEVESVMSNYKIEGVEFTYSKVADIHTYSEGGQVWLEYDLPSSLAKTLGLSGKTRYTSQDINDALNDMLVTSGQATRNALENYMSTDGKRNTMTTDANGYAAANNLDIGLYLVIETKVPANVVETVDPFFVQIPMTDLEGDNWFYDLTLYPKNQTGMPTLDKLVRQHDDAELYNKPEYDDTATGSEGDVMDYIFVSHLPRIDSHATSLQQYSFVDKMDKGLTYNKDTQIYFYDNEADAYANNTSAAFDHWQLNEYGSEDVRIEYAGSGSEYNQMTVVPTAAGLKKLNDGKDIKSNVGLDDDFKRLGEVSKYSEAYMVIAYSVTINSDATPTLGDMGNTNDVVLTWKRTSTDYIDTLEDRCRVFTFGLDVTKTFSGNKSDGSKPDPTKVKFVLQNSTDGHYVNAKSSSAGLYYVTDAVKGATESEGTVFSPDSDGKLIIKGLEANEYILTEIETEDGFNLLKEPIVVNIVCTDDDITATQTTLYDIVDKANNPYKEVLDVPNDRASATVDGSTTVMGAATAKGNKVSTNALVEMGITNTPGTKLPMTGGTGTILFTLVGCALAVVGVALVTKKSKKSSDAQ